MTKSTFKMTESSKIEITFPKKLKILSHLLRQNSSLANVYFGEFNLKLAERSFHRMQTCVLDKL
ncbi:hypothetical protein CH354_01890 [Leptospira levettii]|nr:hypothetical protein CH354_01890 [Leptospira levettii]PKA01223.1 hypothetical protein CH369_05430 [Leptospira levettii]